MPRKPREEFPGAVHHAYARGVNHLATLDPVRLLWLDTPRLLGYFGADGGDSRGRYLEFVALG